MEKPVRAPNFLIIYTVWLLIAACGGAFWVHRSEHRQRQVLRAEAVLDANHVAARLRYARLEMQGFLRALARTRDIEAVLQDPGLIQALRQPEPEAATLASLPAVADLSGRLEKMAVDVESRLLMVVDARGRCVASSDWRNPDSALGNVFADRTHLRQSLAGQVGEAYLMGRHTKVLGSYFAVPLFRGGAIAGAVVLQTSAATWSARIGLGRIPVLVCESHGVILFANRPEWIQTLLPGHSNISEAQSLADFGQARLPATPLTLTGAGDLRDGAGQTWLAIDVPVYDSPLRVHLLASVEPLASYARGQWLRVVLIVLLGCLVIWAVERNRLRLAALQRLTWQDPLTQVLNRRGFDAQSALEWTRAVRFNRPLTVLAIDLDHFKSVNDRFGHPAGDYVLRITASLCKAQLRDMDLVARMGGEEFTILLPETDLAHARLVAERIRLAVQNLGASWDDLPILATVSIGLAERTGADTSLAGVMARADEALYRAKHDGRNRLAER